MRTISPSELTDFTFCQKMWYLKRHLGLIPRKIGYKDLAAWMGISVGSGIEYYYSKGESLDVSIYVAQNQFTHEKEYNLGIGREWDYGVKDYVEKIPPLIEKHIRSALCNTDIWLQGGQVLNVEHINRDWGDSRSDMTLLDSMGNGIILDWKCKLKSDSDKFSISRDIDLGGNQSELYPLAWTSEGNQPPIKIMRFVYLMEGKLPQVEDKIINPRRQEKWLKSYGMVVSTINHLELDKSTMSDKLWENPYHITPWGYPCEFREHCLNGEHNQGGLSEFIQVERVKR